MMRYLERVCLSAGVQRIFLLSTQTMQWFTERGFRPAPVSDLPPLRRATYDTARRSRVYMKHLDRMTARDYDEAELFALKRNKGVFFPKPLYEPQSPVELGPEASRES